MSYYPQQYFQAPSESRNYSGVAPAPVSTEPTSPNASTPAPISEHLIQSQPLAQNAPTSGSIHYPAGEIAPRQADRNPDQAPTSSNRHALAQNSEDTTQPQPRTPYYDPAGASSPEQQPDRIPGNNVHFTGLSHAPSRRSGEPIQYISAGNSRSEFSPRPSQRPQGTPYSPRRERSRSRSRSPNRYYVAQAGTTIIVPPHRSQDGHDQGTIIIQTPDPSREQHLPYIPRRGRSRSRSRSQSPNRYTPGAPIIVQQRPRSQDGYGQGPTIIQTGREQIVGEPYSPRQGRSRSRSRSPNRYTPGAPIVAPSQNGYAQGPVVIQSGSPPSPSRYPTMIPMTENGAGPTVVHVPASQPLSRYAPQTQWVGAAYEAPATYENTSGDLSWFLQIYSNKIEVPRSMIQDPQNGRTMLTLEAQLHDVIAGSIVPLTVQYPPHEVEKIKNQAKLFFASFASDAQWYVNVENLPPAVGKVISGLTSNSKKSDLGFRFMRFRFPYVTFEWFLQTPYTELMPGGYGYRSNQNRNQNPVEIETLWKAWSRTGAASGLVAYGTIKDTVQRESYAIGYGAPGLVITKRHFIFTRVFQPELMTPVPYPRELPPFAYRDDIMVFTTSWTVIQFLRSSQIRMAFLIAISALFASLQPIVAKYTFTGGWVFAGIGVLSGLISVFAVLFGWVLTRSEANAATQRQIVDDKN